jgi:outer membrane immunogenic protein
MIWQGAAAMKNLLLGGVALIVLAGAANAADVRVKMPVKAPPPVAAYDWNGFYIGAYYGSAIEQAKGETPPPGNPAGTRTGGFDILALGAAFGGTLGYNRQFSPNWLIGLEGDFGLMYGVDRTFKEYNDVLHSGAKADWYGTIRGRFGYVTGPSLLYATGGVAFVRTSDTFGGTIGLAQPAIVSTQTRVGWTVGAGIETKLSRNWTTKTEYLYIDTGVASFGSDPFGVGITPGSGPLVPTTYNQTFHVIKTGLNYKLDGNGEALPFFNAALLPSDHNWNGLYAGVNAGLGVSLVRAFDYDFTPFFRGEENIDGTGLAGGVQIGYNYLVSPRLFIGVEGDIGYLGVHGSVTDWFDTSAVFEVKTNWYATARGRFGTTTGPALLYVTGGAAWVGLQDGFGNISPTIGDLTTRVANGWTLGGGTEVALNSYWSAKVESLYIDAGHSIHNNRPTGIGFLADYKDRFMIVRAGLNYKIGGADVVKARY